MSDKDNRVRDEAYRLWVEAGRPDGQEQKHWLEAERRVAASGAGKKGAAGKARKPVTVAAPDAHLDEANGPIAKVKEAFAKRRFDRAVKGVEAASAKSGPTAARKPAKAKTAKPTSAKSAAGKSTAPKAAAPAKASSAAATAKTPSAAKNAKPRTTAAVKPATSKPKSAAAPAKATTAAKTAKAKP